MDHSENGHVEHHEVELPILEVPLAGVEIKVGRIRDTNDRVLAIGPVGVVFMLPLDSEISAHGRA